MTSAKNRFARLAALAALLVAGTSGIAYASSAGMPVLQAPLQSLFSTYFDLGSWYAIAAALALAVIAVASLVYMLASTIGSENALRWARMQVYEALLGIVFIGIFFMLYSLLLTNPQSSLSAMNLVPPSCGTTAPTISPAPSDVYGMSACDLSAFISTSTDLFQVLYYVSWFGGVTPGFNAKFSIPPTSPSGGVSISTGLPSIFPSSGEQLISIGFGFLVFMMMLNGLQMILISVAPLFLAMLISIGIIAWIVGFSRRFGGTMIAFAIGFGVIYPLLVIITYGFIDTALAGSNILSLLSTLPQYLLGGSVLGSYGIGTTLPAILQTFFTDFGYVFAGLTFIPFLNFMILDAFIIDFSKVIGERVSFMDLIGNLV
jgi:hypothetical protein